MARPCRPGEEAITVVGMSIRNATIGMLIAINMMNSPQMAVPAALYGLLMYVFGFVLIGYGRATIKAGVEGALTSFETV